MRILIAGATGAIGRPLVRRLRANQNEVFALTRSPDSAPALKEIGVEAVVADALDAAAVKAAIGRIRPDAVINELTSLPRHYTPAEMKAVAERDRKVRVEGNINLLAAHAPLPAAKFRIPPGPPAAPAPLPPPHTTSRRKPVASALVADGVRACCRSTCATSRQRTGFGHQGPTRSTTRRGLGALRTRKPDASLSSVRARLSGFRSKTDECRYRRSHEARFQEWT